MIVFAYNFPHKKTQDFLFHLFANGIKVSHVFAADAVKLDIPPSEVRTKIRHCTPLYPSDVAKAIGVECLLFSGGHHSERRLLESGAAVIACLSEVSARLIG